MSKLGTKRAIQIAVLSLSALVSIPVGAAPAPPAGPHPRLFMSAANLAAFVANAKAKGTVAEFIVANCQETIDKPEWYTDRGGADGSTWPGAAVACAFAYKATQNANFLTQATKYWNASLNDDQTLGDGKGCVAGASTDWQSWAASGNGATPAVIQTITHDTGYPMRWYGPFVALTYDWLHDAPGVDESLRSHTRMCLTNWVDYYTQYGYHNDEPGANYGAGYVIGKTLTAIAFSGENGTAGDRIWSETVDDLFGKLLVGKGLAGSADPVGRPAGVLVGGDWGEGWQYGPLSVIEYAAAARALEEAGAPFPEMDAWTNSLIVRAMHGSVPTMDGMFNSNGDLDSEDVYPSASANQFDAVLLGPSSDAAAAWATFMKQQGQLRGDFIWNALAEARVVTPQDYRAQTPTAPLWYLARGTRTVFARTSWNADAFWGVFSSPPQVVSDHHHFSATNFVFSRGSDHLIVDPSNYGEPGTLATNAATADSTVVTGDYAPSQTPWSKAELLWARASSAAVFAARGDFANAFIFSDNASDIPYARRDWVMLPEGEIVIIDRVQTTDAAHQLYVNLHANTNGTLKLNGTIASGAVGASQVAIHGVLLPKGTVSITQPPVQDNYEYPCGSCTEGRFAVDNYGVKVPGPWAVAVHVIDGLAAGEALAEVGSLNDENFDPAPQLNASVLGAAVYRASKQSYVVASSAQREESGATMTYGVPGGSTGRHIVFDAPEQADGRSTVVAAAEAGRCVVTITAGAGFEGHPLMFSVSSAADGCQVSEDTNVPSGVEPPGGGVSKQGSGATYDTGSPKNAGGCGCAIIGQGSPTSPRWFLFGAGLLVLCRRRRRESHRLPKWTLALLAVLASCLGIQACSTGKGDTRLNSPDAGTDSAAAAVPTIDGFIANPSTLPDGDGSTTLSWSVRGATSISLDQGIGETSGSSCSVSLTATTSYTLTATNANGVSTASLTVRVGGTVGVNPPSGGRYAAMIAPVDGETFVGPSVDLRLVGVGRDENNYKGDGPGSGHSQAASVEFFVDGASVLKVDAVNSEYWVFKGFAPGLPLSPGDHTVFVRSYYTTNPGPTAQVDSQPVTITVQAPPTYAQTIEMTSDLTLADATSWLGTSASRVRVNGHGHRIYAASAATAITWKYVDFYDLGDPSSTESNGIDVTTTGNVTVQNCRFDYSNPVQFSLGGAATAEIRDNLFRSNMRQPLGQLPYGDSFPTVRFAGASTGVKTFAGNNVGAGWVDFQAVNHWTVGGDTDADSNILVGPRVGIHFDYQGHEGASSDIVVRHNYSDHIYYGGWSQGNNLEAGGNSTLLAEHNILIGSSWTIRGMAGEFRYNLVLMGGEDWMWLDNNANVHHNVFVGGDNNRSGLYNTYGNTGIRIQNNTLDGMGSTTGGVNAILVTGAENVSSNLFMNLAYTPISIENNGTLNADYNLFWNSTSPAYSDSRAPAHDLQADPKLTNPATYAYEFDEKAVWQRTQMVHEILASYRSKYMPTVTSPAIDSGDPTPYGAGNDIGAIGAGMTNSSDRFGM